MRLRVYGCTVCAHQAGDVGTHHVHAHLLLKHAQNGVVKEGAALHHNFAAQLLGARSADDLIDGILHDAHGEAGGNVFRRGAVLLRLLH